MAWTTPRTWVANEILTAALLNAQLRDNSLELDVAKITGEGDYIVSNGANSLVARQYGSARVDTIETRVLAAYGNLATVGPQVTLTTGTSALIFFNCQLDSNTVNIQSKASYSISGATTSASSDTRSLLRDGMPANNGSAIGTVDARTDLVAGSNTFTMEYASDGVATATFNARWLMVLPL